MLAACKANGNEQERPRNGGIASPEIPTTFLRRSAIAAKTRADHANVHPVPKLSFDRPRHRAMFDALRAFGWKLAFRLYPAYRGTGGRVTHISPDWSRVEVKLPLNWRTRNYVDTIFGGSMYGAVDPIYMLMLIKRLGDDYTVWDKAAEIRFLQPGEETLHATFELPEGEIHEIRNSLSPGESLDREYAVELVDATREVRA